MHREVRLRALRDSPESFAETAEEAEEQPLSYWEELTRSVTDLNRHAMFLACEGDAVLGSTYGLPDRDNRETARIGGMWVAPSHRRRGVGHALLQAALSWAREQGFRRAGLWAPAASSAALSLYRQAGFKETERRQPLRTDAVLQIVEFERDLQTQ